VRRARRWLKAQSKYEFQQLRNLDSGYALDILTVAVVEILLIVIIFLKLLVEGN
jgi:hypothetical protein